jgi:Family of unknown function (DUF6527)
MKTATVKHAHGYYPFTSATPRRRSRCVAIDERVCLAPTTYRGALGGFLIGHDAPDLPVRCDGALMVVLVDGHPTWAISGSLEAGDLTLSPSVLCKRDGFHGFIQNGRWMPV